jgi:hypothetical protein
MSLGTHEDRAKVGGDVLMVLYRGAVVFVTGSWTLMFIVMELDMLQPEPVYSLVHCVRVCVWQHIAGELGSASSASGRSISRTLNSGSTSVRMESTLAYRSIYVKFIKLVYVCNIYICISFAVYICSGLM